MIDRLELHWRLLRRKISRSEWAIHLLGLSRSEESPNSPGLVMIQIDGLSQKQFQKALARENLPFIKRLLNKEGYRLQPLYSGLPSSTPAVQGEIFFGVKTAVPAFSFIDRKTGKIEVMLNSKSVAEKLAASAESLLEGGSAYSNIYSVGAKECRFCADNFGFGDFFPSGWFPWLIVLLTNFSSIVRTVFLFIAELALAFYDLVRGLISGQDFFKELKFVPTRVAICILLREMITIGAKIDVARGLPIIHLNFLGYDEQSHRRGPSSAFAHWALKGIDGAIGRICRAAWHSSRRSYDVWIYSDHGQEGVIPYPTLNGRTVQEAVAEVFDDAREGPPLQPFERSGVQSHRAHLLRGNKRRKSAEAEIINEESGYGKRVVVTAMGPIGHVYAPKEFDSVERERLALGLVESARIPLVLAKDGAGLARAWTARGSYVLPEQAAEVLGEAHPYLDEVAKDLVGLVHHPNAGDFVISGWRSEGQSLSFPIENGSHAGPGFNETSAFVMAPADTPFYRRGKKYLRPANLREAALRFLKRDREDEEPDAPMILVRRGRLRVMTYNVHSCIGMDGRLSPERIARVIAQHDPDVVALQELDVGKARSGSIDQARLLAEILEMRYHFHPTIHLEEEKYGDAILTRHPMHLVRAAPLPTLNGRRRQLEPRGALWVTLEVDGHRIQFINTHLGLRPRERVVQSEALAGPEWLTHPDCTGPIVLCGDFNALPRSPACRVLCGKLHDSQVILDGHRPLNTWFGRAPFGRIDHVFTSHEIKVMGIEVPHTALTRAASDHLPLVVDMNFS